MFLLSAHAQAGLIRKAEPVTRTAKSSRCLCLVSSGGQRREILHGCLEDRIGGWGSPAGRVSAGSFYGPLTISLAHTQLSSPFPPELFPWFSGLLRLPCHSFTPKSFPYKIQT